VKLLRAVTGMSASVTWVVITGTMSRAGWSGHLHGTGLIACRVSRHVANMCADVASCAVATAGDAGRAA
jgi:hypothetical protein